jgi:ZIP family zinc transporter
VTDFVTLSGWALLVTASLATGAVAAAWIRLPETVAAVVTSFGGGILLAAVAFELVPEADRRAGAAWTAIGLLLGAAGYVAADAWLTRDERMEHTRRSGHAAAAGQPMMLPVVPESATYDQAPYPRPAAVSPSPPTAALVGRGDAGRGDVARGDVTRREVARAEVARGEAIAAGIVVDGVPESLALGLMVAGGQPGFALLVAVVIGNLTEAYGAAQPILFGGRSKRFAVGLLAGIGVVLGLATLAGGSAGLMNDTVIGAAQAVAGGAVIAVLSISIIPYTFEQVSSRVALATVLGFCAGYLLS